MRIPKYAYFIAGNFFFVCITVYDHKKSNKNNSLSNNFCIDKELMNVNTNDVEAIFENHLKLNNLLYYKLGYNKPFQFLSYSFNNKIKDIFNIDSVEYKSNYNYDFNKISDFFLNIHIFFN